MYEGIHQRRRRTGFVTVTEPGDDVADQLCRAVLSLYTNIEQQMLNHRIRMCEEYFVQDYFCLSSNQVYNPDIVNFTSIHFCQFRE